MKSYLSSLFVLSLLATACGCFSLETAKAPNGESQVVARNYGWYLFDIVPLCCGNAAENPTCGMVMFRNDVQMDKLQHRVLAHAGKKGLRAENLVWTTYDTVLFHVPIIYATVPIPYFITYREKQLCGVLK